MGKKNIQFFDSGGSINVGNLLTQATLTVMKMEMLETGSRSTYEPRLGEHLHKTAWVPFGRWWSEPVIIDSNRETWSRKELVLNISNKDGGAHVDPDLPEKLENISKKNAMAWVKTEGGPLDNRPDLASIRQIAFEVQQSIEKAGLL